MIQAPSCALPDSTLQLQLLGRMLYCKMSDMVKSNSQGFSPQHIGRLLAIFLQSLALDDQCQDLPPSPTPTPSLVVSIEVSESFDQHAFCIGVCLRRIMR